MEVDMAGTCTWRDVAVGVTCVLITWPHSHNLVWTEIQPVRYLAFGINLQTIHTHIRRNTHLIVFAFKHKPVRIHTSKTEHIIIIIIIIITVLIIRFLLPIIFLTFFISTSNICPLFLLPSFLVLSPPPMSARGNCLNQSDGQSIRINTLPEQTKSKIHHIQGNAINKRAIGKFAP